MVSFQAAVQAKLKPAAWSPGVRHMHSHSKTVQHVGSCDVVWKRWIAVCRYLNGLEEGVRRDQWLFGHVTVDHVNKTSGRIRLRLISPSAAWLDVVEIRVEESPEGCVLSKLWGCATGIVPMKVPCAPLFNVVLCWVPFADHAPGKEKRQSEYRLEHLVKAFELSEVRPGGAAIVAGETRTSREVKQTCTRLGDGRDHLLSSHPDGEAEREYGAVSPTTISTA